jgi:type II secretory pathway pseudopilin PulG
MMTSTASDESGDTMLEVIIAIVIIGMVISVFFGAFATASSASSHHRDTVTADRILRDYAEAVKTAVRANCNNSSTYVTTYASPDSRFVVIPDPTAPQPCPPVSGPIAQQVPTINLSVTFGSTSKGLSIAVRTA